MNQERESNQPIWLTQALSLLESSQGFVLATVIGPDGHPLTGCHSLIESHTSNPVAFPGIDQAAWSEAVQSVFVHRSGRMQSFACDTPEKDEDAADVQVFMTYCGPPPEAWIFGAGHIAHALSPILDSLGWRVVVCDDRAEFVTPERFPDAAENRAGSFEESARICAKRAETWLVLVTRGHQHDQAILREYVGHRDPDEPRRPPYIGMIGSKRRVATVRRQLADQGFPAEILNILHAPIGLPIGADTPAEIAISIASEMVAVRRGLSWDHSRGSFHRVTEKTGDSADTAGRLDLWRHVADALASGSPCILATIVERRGSTPRGLGAQMAVFGNGSAIGTIGGGCGEGVVLRTAREMFLGTGEPRLLSVDLTGDQASETTDVCGGWLSVFLEVVK